MNAIRTYIEENYGEDKLMLAEGLDDALVGVGNSFGGVRCAIYSRDRVISILMERDGMTYDEAWEFFDFNIAGAYVGESTPIFGDFHELVTGQFKDTQTSSTSGVITQTQPKPKKKGRKHAVKNKA